MADELDEALEIATSQVRRSQTLGALAAALAKAQAEITGAIKDKTNPHFKSSYADLAAVYEACRAPLAKNAVAVVQSPSANGPRVTVTTLLAHASGEWVEGALTMTAQQNTPQGIGSCITYARRYALAAMAGVAPDDDDGNEASRRVPPLVVEPAKARLAPPKGARYIERIDHEERRTKAGALFTFVNVAFDDGTVAMAKGDQLIALLEQLAQDQVPVVVTLGKTAKGFDEIQKVARWTATAPGITPPLAPTGAPPPVEEIPF